MKASAQAFNTSLLRTGKIKFDQLVGMTMICHLLMEMINSHLAFVLYVREDKIAVQSILLVCRHLSYPLRDVNFNYVVGIAIITMHARNTTVLVGLHHPGIGQI
jgi:hypothetical protein